MGDRVDLLVVGAGLVGLASARAFLELNPDARVCVVDKEQEVAMHQSGRNSGVVHAGLYYPPGSLKARLCREGRELLLAFADEHRLPYRQAGKLVVALDASEFPRLEELARRGRSNGISGLRELDGDGLRELEPNVAGVRALHVPESGVIDFKQVAVAYLDDVRRRGGEVRLRSWMSAITERRGEQIVSFRNGDEMAARKVVVCAGVQSDRMVRSHGKDDGRYRVTPFRGDYFVLSEKAASLVNGLVYPVPDPAFPFLGVHFTPRLDGQVWAGPNAVPSLHREGYGRFRVRPRDAIDSLGFPGTWRLARRYYRMGAAEIWRDTVKYAAVADMRRYLPALTASDVSFGPCGIRAQVLTRDGTLVDDFLFEHRGSVLHVVNAPSPAATASLAIGRRIVAELDGGT